MQSCQVHAHAKCILAGEHAVVHGYPAIVSPLADKVLTVQYEAVDKPLELEVLSLGDVESSAFSSLAAQHKEIFHAALQGALELAGYEGDRLFGIIRLTCNIPIGQGIGFSSALCVAVTRWLVHLDIVAGDELFSFARRLENIFHGQSSGLDIAGALSEGVMRFRMPAEMSLVPLAWHPCLGLSYCGHPKETSKAVKLVRDLIAASPDKARRINERMAASVDLMAEALGSKGDVGMAMLIGAIHEASGCFEEWGLISDPLRAHQEKLMALGALATKPTGAGGGGYVLSLWKDLPKEFASVHQIFPLSLGTVR